MDLFNAYEIRKEYSMTVSGKIKSKTVKAGQYGDLVIFQVGGQTISAFANAKNLSQDAKTLMRELTEGDEAEFTVYESQGKDGRTYKNISDVIKVSRLGGDEGEEHPALDDNKPSVQPGGQAGDTRVRSMALSYAKDWAVALAPVLNEMSSDDWIIERAKRFEQYILTGD